MTTDKSKNFFRVSAEDFKKIPGSQIAYWANQNMLQAFESETMRDVAEPRHGLATSNNDLFLKQWQEVDFCKITTWQSSGKKWFPMNKGGSFRRWFGNFDWVINYENDGLEIKQYASNIYGCSSRTIQNTAFYFKEGITWSALTSGRFSVRYTPAGAIFGSGGYCAFPSMENLYYIQALLNSIIAECFLSLVSPTLNFEVGHIKTVPVIFSKNKNEVSQNTKELITKAKNDWDSYETSWDFQMNPLIAVSGQWAVGSGQKKLIAEIYHSLRQEWKQQTEEMRNLEIENNRIFIDAYGLQDELSPEVPWNEITLTCNPWYRYGKSPAEISVASEQQKTNHWTLATSHLQESMPMDSALEQRLLEDTIKEFISYAVGCMMGRYSPEKPGLILANQGSGVDDYFNIMGERDSRIAQGVLLSPTTTSYIDEPYSRNECGGIEYHQIIDFDGVLPILDEEWFVDDIVTQFKNFVAFIFGKENLTANMDFIESVLGKDIRKYFVKDFYKEHIQRYKKRPIYWLFSSPKGSFNALIYLHRYTPDTVSIVLNEYLRELMTKLSTRIKHLIEENNRADISNADKTRNLKQIDKYTAQLAELEDYERDIIFPLAQQKIVIDLDDGVKVNYCKFGAALKKIPGLEAKEE